MTITPNIDIFEQKIGIHTIELRRELSIDEWERLNEIRAEKSSDPGWRFAPMCPGMRFALIDASGRQLRVIVDPRLLCHDISQDQNAYYGITASGDKLLKKAMQRFDSIWNGILQCTLDDFQLHRVDICCNVVFCFGDETTVPNYIELLRRTPHNGLYHEEAFADPEERAHQFKLANVMRALTVYDKVYQQRHCFAGEKPPCPAMMRVELQLMRRQILRDDVFFDTHKQIRHYMRTAPELLRKWLPQILMPHPYVSRQELEEMVAQSPCYSKVKEGMLRLASLLEQSTDSVQGLRQMCTELKTTNRDPQKALDHILNAYNALGVAPVPQKIQLEPVLGLPQIIMLACQAPQQAHSTN